MPGLPLGPQPCNRPRPMILSCCRLTYGHYSSTGAPDAQPPLGPSEMLINVVAAGGVDTHGVLRGSKGTPSMSVGV
jgi:hypothetical protein